MSDPVASSRQGDYQPFATFALVWAMATLAHQLAFTFWTESWQGWVLLVTVIAVLYEPACVIRFAALVLASLVNLWHKLPFVPNHILFEGMLHLIMLIVLMSYFFSAAGRRQWLQAMRPVGTPAIVFLLAAGLKGLYFLLPSIPQGYLLGAVTTLFLLVALSRLLFRIPAQPSGELTLERFSPIIRVAVVIMYLWAVIQKLNWDYFNIEVSCAAVLHREIASYFGGLVPTAPWALMTAAVGSLVFEFGIPTLLIFKRTRYIGFVAAVGFHLWLSIHPAAGIFSFTALILAFLAVFLPLSWGRNLQGIWNRQLCWVGGGDILRGRRRARAFVLFGFFAALLTQGFLYLTIERSYAVFEKANRVGFFAFFIWGCWLGTCYLIAGWMSRKESAELPYRAKWGLAWVGLLPVLLNGAYPWLGGRTQTSFSMYSNLRSEGEGNHMFLRRIDFFKLQSDMVEVVDSTPDILGPSQRPRGIQQFANRGHHMIPWFEFRRLVSEMPGDLQVTYRRNGEDLVLERKGEIIQGDPLAFEPLPLLSRKFLWFRRLESLDGPMTCTH